MANITGSRRLEVGNDNSKVSAAMNEAENFLKELNLDEKTTLRIRLLTEEVLEMVKTMVGEFKGEFWVESTGKEFRIHLDGTAEIDLEKERELLSASKDGVNVSVKGFGAKISRFIRHHSEYMDELLDAMGESTTADFMYVGAMDGCISQTSMAWSMMQYKQYLESGQEQGQQIEEDLDELEKSILANLADDIKVGVKDDDITITVIKKI
ncbi:MAG: hypothetical protein IK152_01360 [Lachnospiraceae bacterium]|nr:hypothetical protein [Lachnospiraceae bacterium]